MRFASRTLCGWWGSLGLLTLVACGKPQRPHASAEDREAAREVRVGRAELRVMMKTLTVSGTLAPQETSTLSAKVSGRIERLAVDIGSLVQKGNLIAQIDTRDYQLKVQQSSAALAEARAALGLPTEGDDDQLEGQKISAVKQAKAVLEEATKSIERVRRLTQSRIASASELDAAEAAYQVALTRYDAALEEGQARLAALAVRRVEDQIARKQLADASVLAPFDGAIQSRPANPGEFVSTGTPIATLVKIDPLRLRLEVPERESILVRTGQTVRLTVTGDTNTYSGRIARLSPALSEANRMLLAEADVPNSGGLRAGLFAKAEVVIDEHEQGVSVPLNALVTFAGLEKVVTIRSGKALEITIATGRRGPDWLEVLSGLSAGTEVVLNPEGLRSGQAVRVQRASPPAGAEATKAFTADE